MISTKLLLNQIKWAFIIALPLVSVTSHPIPGVAQPYQVGSHSSSGLRIRFNDQKGGHDGSSRGRPGGREGTGSRGNCPSVKVPLTALIPTSNLGLAVEAQPTLWFFVPYNSKETLSGEFSLQDEQNNDVYRAPFTLPASPGIVSLSLTNAAPLKVNKTYQWHFKLYCDRQKSSNPIFVRGWVQRVALKSDLEKQLKAATTPRERIAVYAENGLWYTALTELAKLRLAQPQNPTLNHDWATLLKDIGLDNLAQNPVVGEVKK